MFAAQLHNKLTRSEERKEDLLTSNVFGVWRYLPPKLGLTQFLMTAERLDGVKLSGLEDIETAELQFWPWLLEESSKGAEPDVLMEMTSSKQERWLILVESKYLSGKSSFPDEGDLPNDQLAREMQNLRSLAHRKRINQYALVYITAHIVMPRGDIKEAIQELEKTNTGDGSADKFYWTSWRRLPNILSKVKAQCDRYAGTLLGDLEAIIRRMGLTFYEGISYKGWPLGATWTFRRAILPLTFNWLPITIGRYTFRKVPIKPVKFIWTF